MEIMKCYVSHHETLSSASAAASFSSCLFKGLPSVTKMTCSVGMRSVDIYFSLTNSWDAFAVCFGSLTVFTVKYHLVSFQLDLSRGSGPVHVTVHPAVSVRLDCGDDAPPFQRSVLVARLDVESSSVMKHFSCLLWSLRPFDFSKYVSDCLVTSKVFAVSLIGLFYFFSFLLHLHWHLYLSLTHNSNKQVPNGTSTTDLLSAILLWNNEGTGFTCPSN